MMKLSPSYSDTKTWKGSIEREYNLNSAEIKKLHSEIVERDKSTCRYCEFTSKKFLTVNPVDADWQNHSKDNLVTVCPMCKLVLNADYGCQKESIVELYRECRFSQNEVIKITREMRKEGRTDEQIIRHLGLKDKVPFKRDRAYLGNLIAFITSWKGSFGQAEEALDHCYS
jgi:hypothetical protein